MRQVVLDTETTGLDPEQGHRIIEIGGVELENRRLTNRRLHYYLRPDREIDDGALDVHGITREFLEDKPRFAEVYPEILAFIAGAEVIIHNATFDIGFLNYELAQLDDVSLQIDQDCRIIDSLALARQLHPGQRNNLDALCKRYRIDSSARRLHGALLDAEILADVYLAMTGGQAALEFSGVNETAIFAASADTPRRTRPAGALRVVRASQEEIEAHTRQLAGIDENSNGQCLWLRLEES